MIADEELIQRAVEITKLREISPSVRVGTVGSALLTSKGNIYLGVCIVTSCSLGLCAENNAIVNMITNEESQIASIVAVHMNGVIIPPCGRCRELIYQIDERNMDTRIILDRNKAVSLRELLPEPWMVKREEGNAAFGKK